MPISDESEPITTDLSTTESDEERMRRALADLGGAGQRTRFPPPRASASGLPASASVKPGHSSPAHSGPALSGSAFSGSVQSGSGQSGARPHALEPGQPAAKWSQPTRPQLSSGGLQGGAGPRRNRFAGSADVPVVHLPLGPGRERGRSEALAGPEHQAAPSRAVPDERPLREAQAKLDAVCSQLGLAELKLKDALEVIRRQDADIAALQSTVSSQQAELVAAQAALSGDGHHSLAATPRQAVPDGQVSGKKPVGRPRGPAKTKDAAPRRKPVREPKPIKWWIKSS